MLYFIIDTIQKFYHILNDKNPKDHDRNYRRENISSATLLVLLRSCTSGNDVFCLYSQRLFLCNIVL